MEEKIDIHDSEHEYKLAIENLKNDNKISEKNKKFILNYLEASAIGRTAKKNSRKKQTGTRARLRSLYLLKIPARYFKKDFDALTMKDMENLIRDINNNNIKKSFLGSHSKIYSGVTKTNIKIAFIHCLRWVLKDSKRFYELTDWIETITPKVETLALSEEDIIRLMQSATNTKTKFLIGFLFNCGCRIEEFMNIRMSDLTLVKDNPQYYTVVLREEFSKTKGRTVPLNWKGMTKLIEEYLAIHEDKNNSNAVLFPSTYDSVRICLSRLGKKVLNKRVYPHLFRHSSATYDANKLNRYQLCYKYGWSFSSDQPDRYIDRAKINTKEIAQHYQKELQEDIMKELTILKEQNQSLRDSDKLFAEKMIQLLEIMKDNKLAVKLISRVDKEKLKQLFN